MTTIQNENQTVTGVTSVGRLQCETIVQRYSDRVCMINGMAYTTYVASVTPAAAADVFYVMINTSDYPILIQELRYYDAHAGEIIHIQTGATYTPATASAAVEPRNRLVGSTNLASSYATIENGTDITGDSSATIMESQAVNNTETVVSFRERPIVLARNRCLNLEASGGGSAIRYEVDFCFLNPSDYINN
jgi:hypothetical protein